MLDHIFKNIGNLSRFILREDRFRILMWLVGILFFTLIVPVAYVEMFDSKEEQDTLAETMRNPAMTAMVGPGDLENYTVGAMTTHQMLLFTAIVVGVMNILLVNRHTRAQEEDGRTEMIRSLSVGRLSNLNAAFVVYSLVNVVMALLIGLGLDALEIVSMNLEGSLLFGAIIGATGILFISVTAIFAQIMDSSRGTIGFSIAFLLIAYLVRAIGDVSNDSLSWLSPLGWVTKTEAYSDNNWLPVFLMLGISILLFLIANYFYANRDVGAGILPTKPGRKNASPFLRSPINFAFRLQRTSIFAWAVGMFLMGASYGSVFGDLDRFFEGNEILEQLLASGEGYSYTEQFLPMLMVVMAIIAMIPTLLGLLKLRTEEKNSRLDLLYSNVISRRRIMGSYLLLSTVIGFVMVSLSAIGLWMAASIVMDEGMPFGTVYKAAIVYYPAVLVMIGITAWLIGYLPKFTNYIWLYVLYTFVVLYLGGLLDFPDWVSKLTPFGYIPQLPMEDLNLWIIIILVVTAIIFMFLGLTGYRKRDID